jgi:CRISPR/Cas system-associated exonuclease Cas4 (RecB family)
VLLLAAGLTLVAIALLVYAQRIGQQTGIRVGTPIVASDVGIASALLLEAPSAGIRGRPDYLLRESGRGRIYPMEVKPTRESTVLYEADALQLAAYMVAAEAEFGREFAGYGVVRYRSTEFRVALTPDLRRRCLAAAEGVRAARCSTEVHRSHALPGRCRGCALFGRCGEELDKR